LGIIGLITSRKFIVTFIPSLVFLIYFSLIREFFIAIISFAIGMAILCLLKYMEKKSIRTRIDQVLTTVVFHMYGLALGETSASDLVNTIAKNEEYGFYCEVFKKIHNLAEDFGFGVTNATGQVSKTVKPPLKDILVRCKNTFSSVEPRGYLEMESSMLMEEYSGYYERAIKTLETLGGVFISFQSIIVFLIMTLVIMSVFMTSSGTISLGYVAAIFSTALMYFLFRSSAPKQQMVYVGKYPPKLYLVLKWSFMVTVPSSCIFAVLVYFKLGVPFALIVLGSGVSIPGVFGYLLERHVAEIDKNYPTFLKALGENLASTSDLKTALSFILHMEIGPLRNLVTSALTRVKMGIDHRQALETLSAEAASYEVHTSNKILLDSLGRGADPLVIGNALGNRVVKFLEFRKMRDVVANSFQMIVLVTQPLIVVLLTVLAVLAGFMSQYLAAASAGASYFGFNTLPLALIGIGNVVVIFVMAIINALCVKEVSGNYWGTFFLNLGILLIISGVAWIAAHTLIQIVLNSMPTLQLPTPITTTT